MYQAVHSNSRTVRLVRHLRGWDVAVAVVRPSHTRPVDDMEQEACPSDITDLVLYDPGIETRGGRCGGVNLQPAERTKASRIGVGDVETHPLNSRSIQPARFQVPHGCHRS